MKRIKKLLVYTYLFTVTCLLPLLAQSPQELTISAAASLAMPMEEIKTIYEQENPQIKLVYNIGSSGSLQQQIEQGAPVDIFFSAAARQMNALAEKNLIISTTRRDLLKNQIVLITPKNLTLVNSFEDLMKPEVQTIAIGEPESVPAGKYAAEALTFYKILDQVSDKLIYGNSVTQVLTYVDLGNVDAGMVYSTDAKTKEKVRVVATASPESHTPIVYPIAVIKNSKNQQLAQEFIQFLASNPAQEIFTKYGFQIVE